MIPVKLSCGGAVSLFFVSFSAAVFTPEGSTYEIVVAIVFNLQNRCLSYYPLEQIFQRDHAILDMLGPVQSTCLDDKLLGLILISSNNFISHSGRCLSVLSPLVAATFSPKSQSLSPSVES